MGSYQKTLGIQNESYYQGMEVRTYFGKQYRLIIPENIHQTLAVTNSNRIGLYLLP